jgi:hypothetical protein
MIAQRAAIREPDVWCQIGEYLSRQPQKAGALDLLPPMAETPRQVQRRIGISRISMPRAGSSSASSIA